MIKNKVFLPKDAILNARKINNVSKWDERYIEWSGARVKKTILNPKTKQEFLVKYSRYGNNELFIELFNCYLAKSLELNVADYFMCQINQQNVIASRRFTKADQSFSELWEMKDLICHYTTNSSELDKKFGRSNEVLKEHNIDNLFLILEAEFGERVLPSFFRMIAFDSLIGHTDRHWQNYGVLVEGRELKIKFAPLYDTAMAFQVDKTDEQLKEMIDQGTFNDKQWYMFRKKGISKITLDGNIKCNHFDLIEYILSSSTYSNYKLYVARLIKQFNIGFALKVLNQRLFKRGITKVRKDAIILILNKRHEILLDLLDKHL